MAAARRPCGGAAAFRAPPGIAGSVYFFPSPSISRKRTSPMTQPTPAPANEDDKKRMREKVEKLLAQNAHTSEATIALGGRTMAYTATAAFVPVAAGGLDDKRGDPNA